MIGALGASQYAVAKANALVLVSENFNKANGALGNAQTGQAWVQITGGISVNVSANTGVSSLPGNTASACIYTGETEVTLEGTFTFNNFSGSGFIFRVASTNPSFNYYYLDITGSGGTGIRIVRVLSGSGSVRTSYTGAVPSGSTIKLALSGTNMKVYVGATLVIDFTESNLATNTGQGITVSDGSVDNFTVTKP